MIRSNDVMNKHLNLFSYEDPELYEEENLFESTQAPWFYHITHRKNRKEKKIQGVYLHTYIYLFIYMHMCMRLHTFLPVANKKKNCCHYYNIC